MNTTNLKAAFLSIGVLMQIFRAFTLTAKKGYSVVHIDNRNGKPFLAVRHNKRGFTITDRNDNDVTRMVYSELRG